MTLFSLTLPPLCRRGLGFALPILLLAGCSYRISDADVLATTEPAGWYAQRDTLPLELHGQIAGRTSAEIAALAGRPLPEIAPAQRIVLYLNGAEPVSEDRLCEAPGTAAASRAATGATAVTAVLCDGTQAVSRVRGSVRPGLRDDQLGVDLRALQAELFRVLDETPPPA